MYDDLSKIEEVARKNFTERLVFASRRWHDARELCCTHGGSGITMSVGLALEALGLKSPLARYKADYYHLKAYFLALSLFFVTSDLDYSCQEIDPCNYNTVITTVINVITTAHSQLHVITHPAVVVTVT